MSTAAVRISVQEADFDVGAELARAQARQGGRVGAVATFVGLVRDRDVGTDAEISELFLEHYPGVTERSIEAVVAQALERWAVAEVTVIHRVGRLSGKDQIVFVQVASAHRPSAFAACEFLMDYLKTDAVFWKREAIQAPDSGASEHRWVASTDHDRTRREQWQRPPGRAREEG